MPSSCRYNSVLCISDLQSCNPQPEAYLLPTEKSEEPRKIMVSQSTSGDVPESGLDVLNQDGDSVEVALARQLVAA